MIGAVAVQPEKTTAEPQLILLVFAGKEIDELGSSGFDRTTGFFVFGDDHVAQNHKRRVLCCREVFWRVVSCWRGSLFLVDHLMNVFGSLGGNDLQDGTSSGADSERTKDVTAGDGLVGHVRCFPFWLRREDTRTRATKEP